MRRRSRRSLLRLPALLALALVLAAVLSAASVPRAVRLGLKGDDLRESDKVGSKKVDPNAAKRAAHALAKELPPPAPPVPVEAQAAALAQGKGPKVEAEKRSELNREIQRKFQKEASELERKLYNLREEKEKHVDKEHATQGDNFDQTVKAERTWARKNRELRKELVDAIHKSRSAVRELSRVDVFREEGEKRGEFAQGKGPLGDAQFGGLMAAVGRERQAMQQALAVSEKNHEADLEEATGNTEEDEDVSVLDGSLAAPGHALSADTLKRIKTCSRLDRDRDYAYLQLETTSCDEYNDPCDGSWECHYDLFLTGVVRDLGHGDFDVLLADFDGARIETDDYRDVMGEEKSFEEREAELNRRFAPGKYSTESSGEKALLDGQFAMDQQQANAVASGVAVFLQEREEVEEGEGEGGSTAAKTGKLKHSEEEASLGVSSPRDYVRGAHDDGGDEAEDDFDVEEDDVKATAFLESAMEMMLRVHREEAGEGEAEEGAAAGSGGTDSGPDGFAGWAQSTWGQAKSAAAGKVQTAGEVARATWSAVKKQDWAGGVKSEVSAFTDPSTSLKDKFARMQGNMNAGMMPVEYAAQRNSLVAGLELVPFSPLGLVNAIRGRDTDGRSLSTLEVATNVFFWAMPPAKYLKGVKVAARSKVAASVLKGRKVLGPKTMRRLYFLAKNGVKYGKALYAGAKSGTEIVSAVSAALAAGPKAREAWSRMRDAKKRKDWQAFNAAAGDLAREAKSAGSSVKSLVENTGKMYSVGKDLFSFLKSDTKSGDGELVKRWLKGKRPVSVAIDKFNRASKKIRATQWAFFRSRWGKAFFKARRAHKLLKSGKTWVKSRYARARNALLRGSNVGRAWLSKRTAWRAFKRKFASPVSQKRVRGVLKDMRKLGAVVTKTYDRMRAKFGGAKQRVTNALAKASALKNKAKKLVAVAKSGKYRAAFNDALKNGKGDELITSGARKVARQAGVDVLKMAKGIVAKNRRRFVKSAVKKVADKILRRRRRRRKGPGRRASSWLSRFRRRRGRL